MSGTVRLSALGPPALNATIANVACAQTVAGITTDGLISIPIPGVSPASVTAAEGTTLTAASMISGYIIRSGPTAAFTDSVDTAANIIASIPSVTEGYGFDFTVVNVTEYEQTIAEGTGVTLSYVSPQNANVPPLNAVRWRVQVTSASSGAQAVTIYRLVSSGI